MLRQVQGKSESEYISLKSYQTDKRPKTLVTLTNAHFYNLCILSVTHLLHV